MPPTSASTKSAPALMRTAAGGRVSSSSPGVSCAWTKVALEVAGARGLDLENAVAAVGQGIDLLDARERLEWDRFLGLVGLLRKQLPGKSELMRFGAAMSGGLVVRQWLAWIVSPALLYRLVIAQMWSRVLPGARCTVTDWRGGLITCQVRLPPRGSTDEEENAPRDDTVGGPESEAFFWITAGQLTTLASGILGVPAARVDTFLDDDRRAARFEIHLPESHTIAARTARFLRIVLASRKVARTLLGQQSELSSARREVDSLRDEIFELMENAPDGILIHDKGRILYANPALARSIGVDDKRRLIGDRVESFLEFDAGITFEEAVSRAPISLGDGGGGRVSLRGHRRDREAGPAETTNVGTDAESEGLSDDVFFELACSRPIRHAGDRAQLVMIKDVTEHRRLERQLMEAGDGERQRLAMDLHDGLGQLLSGIAFRAETLRRSLGEGDGEATGLARSLVRYSKDAMRQARALARGLDPVGKFEGGLPVALESLARFTQEIHGVITHVRLGTGDRVRLSPNDEIQLYRIAQEAITNAVRHAEASRITIDLAPSSDGGIVLSVVDDGVGFAAGSSRSPAGGGPGLGLKIMRFRAESIGAELAVTSAPGRGTSVLCAFTERAGKSPVPRRDEAGSEAESSRSGLIER